MSREELVALRRAGFDFVRLVVDPGPFLHPGKLERTGLDEALAAHIRAMHDAGLSVIVDVHPGDQHPAYTATALTAGRDTASFKACLALLERLSEMLRGLDPGRVVLELFNEPPIPSRQWQPMLEAAYTAVRAKAPMLRVILSGGDEGSIDGLLQLGTDKFRDDPNALLSFHYYDPYQFTHQGASWNSARYLANVPYPAHARPMQEAAQASLAAIDRARLQEAEKRRARADATDRLAAYQRSGFARPAIAQGFTRVTRWAAERRIPADRIILGEFGTIATTQTTTAAAERAHWLRDVREEAEQNGFAWAAWVYRGSGGYSMTPPGAARIDSTILNALGLVP